MFGLITAVIGVALAVLTAIMAIFYGGNVFTDNAGKTLYSKSVNGAQQIQAAIQLYQGREGFLPTGDSTTVLGMLVSDNYLSAVPEGNWIVQESQIVRELATVKQCKAINEVAGFDVSSVPNGCPSCADAAYSTWPGCTNPTPFN